MVVVDVVVSDVADIALTTVVTVDADVNVALLYRVWQLPLLWMLLLLQQLLLLLLTLLCYAVAVALLAVWPSSKQHRK